MKSTAIISLLLSLFLAGAAQATPFAKGNAGHGKELLDQHCTACHAKQFGGDGSSIYTRKDRMIHSASSLAQRIDTCNANTGNSLFPEDEADIGAYLNQTYYKFK
jgi:mono/diheme cytochrome c family protein